MKVTTLVICCVSLLKTGRSAEVCGTPGCVELADIFRYNMDLSVNPCDNFYLYTCGGLRSKTIIPEAEAAFGAQEQVDKVIREQLRKELEAATIKGQPAAFQKTKDFYQSCMDEETNERRGLNDMKRRLQAYGGWPVIQHDWNEANFDWTHTSMKMAAAGNYVDQILDIFVGISSDNLSKRMLKLGGSYHVLSNYRLQAGMDDIVLKTYAKVLVETAVAFGACKERAHIEIMEALQFEVQLVNISLSYSTSKVMKISELQEKFPFVQWLPYARAVIGDSLGITADEPVYVYNLLYFEKLGKLLESTPKRVVANHIMSQLIFVQRENLNQRILDIQQQLTEVRFGKTSLPPRWEFCLGKIWGFMDDLLGAAFIRKYFSPESKQRAIGVTKEFLKQFGTIISEEDWMDSETRSRALDKVENIKYFIGYPDELLDDKILNDVYKQLTTKKSDLFGNILSIQRWHDEIAHQKLRKPVDLTRWDEQTLMFITIANADYHTSLNRIDVLAASLQRNFFGLDRPDFLNYATLASTVGHELTHSVDNEGGQYDKYGKRNNWWTPYSEEAFKKRTQALIDEYSTYVVKEVNETLNGKNIQGEVIADQGGYKIAHKAMEGWLADHASQDHRLVTFEQYSARQIFWIGAASSWCTKERVEFVKFMVEEDPHPPAEFRVNGPFRNSDQFAADWGCPIGSYMNPQHKVNVW